MTRSQLRRRVAALVRVVAAVDTGRDLVWTDAERRELVPVLRQVGVQLVTPQGARRMGHRVKRGAWGPILVDSGLRLYVLGLQTVPLARPTAAQRRERDRQQQLFEAHRGHWEFDPRVDR